MRIDWVILKTIRSTLFARYNHRDHLGLIVEKGNAAYFIL